jgi:uncharacterized protein YjbI with pentapeptide repeats
MPRNYAGQTLKGRPFKPEDDLKGADFTGSTLLGVNFGSLDLTDAIFVDTDIRGSTLVLQARVCLANTKMPAYQAS